MSWAEEEAARVLGRNGWTEDMRGWPLALAVARAAIESAIAKAAEVADELAADPRAAYRDVHMDGSHQRIQGAVAYASRRTAARIRALGTGGKP